MALGVRGCNPIWFEVDLQAHAFDDNFWFYVLENTIPYIPATVYHDADLSIPWTNPIRFLANGTLPIDIFYDPSKVYRLEFRQNLDLAPPSQADPLIYEVNDYSPTSGGITPTPTVSLTSENEATNGQFALISFASPLTITTAGTYEIAPGWFLDLAGTGSAVISQVPLTSTTPTTSNAPYALHLVLSGWDADSVKLRQRFQQNGVLWSGKNVAVAITARTGVGFQSLTGNIVDSNGTPTNVLSVPVVSGSFTEYRGHGFIPFPPTNTNIPPAAYTEFQLLLASTNDIYLTSFQITVSDTIAEPTYIQDTIDRQIDHTFHYYRNSILFLPKESLLTGWDFGLNPWQTHATAASNFATFGYTADQTFVVQQQYVELATMNNIEVGRAIYSRNYGLFVGAVTATNIFAIGQYIDSSTVRPYWGSNLSSVVKINAQLKGSNTFIRVKMRLIERADNPASLARLEPINTWSTGAEPTFTAGWAVRNPKNDPVYHVVNGSNTLVFEGMPLIAATSDDMSLGIVIYTLDAMDSTGTADNIVFNSVSLVPNEFAIDTNVLSFDETLRKCEFYYEKSYPAIDIEGINASAENNLLRRQRINTAVGAKASAFSIEYRTIKRQSPPRVLLYSPTGTTQGFVQANVYTNGALSAQADAAITNWTATAGAKTVAYLPNGNTTLAASAGDDAFIAFQYTINARLGL